MEYAGVMEMPRSFELVSSAESIPLPMVGIERSNITKYLAVLRELGYVERLTPATVRRPEQSRQGRYVITDEELSRDIS
ncbi:MAG: hypothetical protein IAE79_28230 [Anaerolinea sp.]|nr:hypothetical protein [Anaerolinea sp.]